MEELARISDSELLGRMPQVVQAERTAISQVIEHLMEIDRRRLYLDQACSSLFSYCTERLGYSEDAAMKRVRVARLARRFGQVLNDLRSGALHLTGLFLLSQYLNEENFEGLMAEACGKSRREIERILARRFPRPDLPTRIRPLGPEPMMFGFTGETSTSAQAVTCLGPGNTETPSDSGISNAVDPPAVPMPNPDPGSGEALAALRYHIEFTASGALYEKIERAQELLSHSLPSGDLAALLERALDELIRAESERRFGRRSAKGAKNSRRQRALKTGSRHVPVAIADAVWERDAEQCTWVDGEGRRCSERHFLTIEHRQPYALGGPATLENLCLLCKAHNAHTARKVFGETYIAKRTQRTQHRLRVKCVGHQNHTKNAEGMEPADEIQNVEPTDRVNSIALDENASRAPRSECAEHEARSNRALAEKASHAGNAEHISDVDCAHCARHGEHRSGCYVQYAEFLTARGKVHAALRRLGFREREVITVLVEIEADGSAFDLESLLRAALKRLGRVAA